MGIQIKEPCKEDWSKMTASEKGAFCKVCAIDVHDFTDKSPIQIKSILAEQLNKEGTTCGRITNIQMDQINDEFFQWKNEQESFRAIWMISLVAVFGLALFSCQNTISKEIVSQINENGTELIDQDTSAVARNSNQNDSLTAETPEIDSNFTFLPELIITTGGAITSVEGINIPWLHGEYILGGFGVTNPIIESEICTVLMGDINTTGVVSLTPEFKKEILSESKTLFKQAQSTAQNPPLERAPRTPDKTQFADHRIVATAGNKGFKAVIRPNPIQVSSKLFLTLYESSEVNIKIHQSGGESPLKSGKTSLIEGQHALELKLFKFPKGEYEMCITCNDVKKIFNFQVI